MDAFTRGLLAQGHRVKILSIATEKHPIVPEAIEEDYRLTTRFEYARLNTAVNSVDAFSSFLTGDSYNISRFHAPEFEQLLVYTLQREVFDLVVFESLFVAPYLPTVRRYCDGPAVLRAHNVEHRIWEQLAVETERLTKRIYLNHLAERLKEYEVNALLDFDAVVAITAADAQLFLSLGCTAPVFTMPFGIDAQRLPPATPGHANHVFHLGAMDWTPNVQGVQWFLDQIWPHVLHELPDVRLKLAGRNFDAELFQHAANVDILGEIEHSWEVMSQSGAMIIPLLSGSGMRIKAIEAMAAGRPVVTTPLGVEGINGSDGVHFSLADDASTFAIRLVDLLKNEQKALAMGTAASEFVRDNFENNGLVQRLMNQLISTFSL